MAHFSWVFHMFVCIYIYIYIYIYMIHHTHTLDNNSKLLSLLEIPFFKMRFTPWTVEHQLWGIELEEKEVQKD